MLSVCSHSCLCLGGDHASSSSPTRSVGEDGELDLDSVQVALRNFQQELRDTQRERVGHTHTRTCTRTHTHTHTHT